ncbi:hypothetical protein [Edaphobacter aggregans]|uniref:hypothetical protein n=1 Tax=Edaphobacter aggregans TaxID=570835 RepID=UPI00054F58C9|nr:hypothetical protein [Edaphobacter aggregans]
MASTKREHVERMLMRARRRAKQAAKLVEKWEKKLADVDRLDVEAKQAKLWEEDALVETA